MQYHALGLLLGHFIPTWNSHVLSPHSNDFKVAGKLHKCNNCFWFTPTIVQLVSVANIVMKICKTQPLLYALFYVAWYQDLLHR